MQHATLTPRVRLGAVPLACALLAGSSAGLLSAQTSGMSVQGVGAANREQIERIFYRGFTSYLTPSSRFAQARQATLRAASELYGESSAAFRAVSQAWTAVGVN